MVNMTDMGCDQSNYATYLLYNEIWPEVLPDVSAMGTTETRQSLEEGVFSVMMSKRIKTLNITVSLLNVYLGFQITVTCITT